METQRGGGAKNDVRHTEIRGTKGVFQHPDSPLPFALSSLRQEAYRRAISQGGWLGLISLWLN